MFLSFFFAPKVKLQVFNFEFCWINWNSFKDKLKSLGRKLSRGGGRGNGKKTENNNKRPKIAEKTKK